MLVSQKSRMKAWGMMCSSGDDSHLTVAIVELSRKMLLRLAVAGESSTNRRKGDFSMIWSTSGRYGYVG